jgi:hypothetical protein
MERMAFPLAERAGAIANWFEPNHTGSSGTAARSCAPAAAISRRQAPTTK